MNFEEKNREIEDLKVESALRNFRESVHGWSEHEFSKLRTIKRSRWEAMWVVLAKPAMGWALGCVLMVTSVGIPVTVHHQRQLVAERNAQQLRQQQLAKQAAEQQATLAMTDDELLRHVDSDIAQDAPDAMQPLASLMTDASTR